MSDVAFADFTEQVLSLPYDQIITLMEKMLESLKQRKVKDKYAEKVSCKGIAHKYANVNLIPQEEKIASMAFSGE